MSQAALAPVGLPMLRAAASNRPRIPASAVFGPAFVAAIAYVDPGNFATNFQGGASYGYRLMWVVLAANLVAVPIQFLSAKLGIVTGQSLPRLCAQTMPRTAAWWMWGQAEAVAMATDLAEFVGAAVGLNLLFHLPMAVAALVTGVISFAVLGLQRRGHRPFEIAIAALLALICIGFSYETLRIGPSSSRSLGGLVPHFAGQGSLLLAVGIIGATVMPHAVYLHSGLTGRRLTFDSADTRRRLIRLERIDVIVALGIAGLVNLSMLALAAALFHGQGGAGDTVTLAAIHSRFGHVVGGTAALAFAAALLASGISSSSVGTCAGQIVMDGFLHRTVPMWARRLVTMSPAIALLCLHVDPTRILIFSQVALCFGVPFAVVPLLRFTSSRRVMGEYVNHAVVTAFMALTILVLTALNVFLIVQTLTS